MGMKGVISCAYLHRLEKGELRNVGFMTVVGYLQACKEPISKFVLELAQSGAFGEVEAQCVTGFTSQESSRSSHKLKLPAVRSAETAAPWCFTACEGCGG